MNLRNPMRPRNGMATTVCTAIIEKEGVLYAALCPELDVATQGATVEEFDRLRPLFAPCVSTFMFGDRSVS